MGARSYYQAASSVNEPRGAGAGLSVRRPPEEGDARGPRAVCSALMSEESPPYGAPRSITSSAAALGWAISTLRGIADALEGAPRKAADALVQLAPTIQELARWAGLVLKR